MLKFGKQMGINKQKDTKKILQVRSKDMTEHNIKQETINNKHEYRSRGFKTVQRQRKQNQTSYQKN